MNGLKILNPSSITKKNTKNLNNKFLEIEGNKKSNKILTKEIDYNKNSENFKFSKGKNIFII